MPVHGCPIIVGNRPSCQPKTWHSGAVSARQISRSIACMALPIRYTTSCGRNRHSSASVSVSTCSVAWPMPKRSRNACVTSCSLCSPGSSAHTRCAVSAVSVVLIDPRCGDRGPRPHRAPTPRTLHIVVRHTAGHGIHRQIDRFPQQSPGGDDDHHGDPQAGQRIEPQPAGQHDQQARRHDRGRYAGISRHVHELRGMSMSPPRPRMNKARLPHSRQCGPWRPGSQ